MTAALTDGQMWWACYLLAAAIAVTGRAVWRRSRTRQTLARWRDRRTWRSLIRRAAPEPWPYDWAVSCPELAARPWHWRVLDR